MSGEEHMQSDSRPSVTTPRVAEEGKGEGEGFWAGVDTIEAWARTYVLSDRLEDKLRPPAPPTSFAGEPSNRLAAPGRPTVLQQAAKSPKRPRSCRTPLQRAKLLHAFLHHEVQAAELMCWALLAFADAPETFRRGLLRIVQDEVRHSCMYVAQLERLGFHYGAFPIRDWF